MDGAEASSNFVCIMHGAFDFVVGYFRSMYSHIKTSCHWSSIRLFVARAASGTKIL